MMMVALGTAAVANAGNPMALQVAPASIDWNTNTWVTLTVSNVASASEVLLELFLDVQTNGVVDAADPLIASYPVLDGRTNTLGSSVIVDDEDGVVNGTIVSRISYFGVDGVLHVVGDYLWQARRPGVPDAVATPFSVTQTAGTAWITGSVIDYVTSNAVPAVAITPECFDETLALPAVWTDVNGAFTWYLPDGVSTADVAAVYAFGPGYFNPEEDQTGTNLVAAHVYADNLAIGANPLPRPLRVVPKIPGLVFEVSGHVYDDQTNAVPGVIVNMEWDDGDNETAAITDSNGVYRVCVTEADDAVCYVDPSSLTRLGLVAVGEERVIANDVSGADLYCPRATLLTGGRVRAADDDAPVVGAVLELDGEMFGAAGVTTGDGRFDIGTIAYTNYQLGGDNFDLIGFTQEPPLEGLSITDSSVTNLDFRPRRTYPISGVVYNRATNRVHEGTVGAFPYPSNRMFWQWDVVTRLNRMGEFRLRTPTGEWVVVVANVPGCVGAVHSDISYWEWDHTHIADPATNTTSGVGGVDFYLESTARIEGVVRGDDTTPLQDITVDAWAMGSEDWTMNGDARTDASGFYSIELPPGSSYAVEIRGQEQGGRYWVSQYYDHETAEDLATPVAAYPDVPATNINFDLAEGGLISGHVVDDDSGQPVEECPVQARALDDSFSHDTETDENGYYEIIVSAGTYTVEARPDWRNLPFAQQYFSNAVLRADAAPLAVAQGGVVSNIDFALLAPSYFFGRVAEAATDMPIEGMMVFAASIPDTNDFWNDWSYYTDEPTDSNGYYRISVPAGDHYIVFVNSGSSYYIGQCWSNQTDYAQAALLAIGPSTNVTGIDFELDVGGRIAGHVFRDDNAEPLAECDMAAQYYGNGQWIGGGQTDLSGYYTLTLPAGSSYRVRALPGNNGQPYVDEWYNDTLDWGAAEAVPVTLTNDTGGVDFSLMVANLDHTSWLAHYFSASELADPDVCGDAADPDHDGADNMEEFVADTHPMQSNSVLRLTWGRRSGSDLRIGWQGGRWARQYLQRCDTLVSNGWADIYTNDTLPTAVSNDLLDTEADMPACFYRVRVERD